MSLRNEPTLPQLGLGTQQFEYLTGGSAVTLQHEWYVLKRSEAPTHAYVSDDGGTTAGQHQAERTRLPRC
jgi:hypothetical protein